MPTEFILTVILAAVVLLLFLTFISRYKRCPSNKILVIYGKTGGGTAAKCVHGGAAFVLPLLQDYEYLDLEPFVVPIDLDNALSQENIRVSVPTTVHSSHLQSARHHAQRGHSPPGPIPRKSSEPGTRHHPRPDARSHCNHEN